MGPAAKLHRFGFARNGFLDSTQNSELECIFKPFGLSHVNKSVWALGLLRVNVNT